MKNKNIVEPIVRTGPNYFHSFAFKNYPAK